MVGNNGTYINILLNTLIRKNECLKKISNLEENQEKILSNPDLTVEEFEEMMSKKQTLINELESLDKGFETVYDRVKDELRINKGYYKETIEKMQTCIVGITELTVKIQAMEERNKTKADSMFAMRRGQVKNVRVSNQTAAMYYKNMVGQHQSGQSYFLDTKN